MTESKKAAGQLTAGGIAAILASACCLGPLLLVTLGFSGAWIGNLAALEPYRPWFIGGALLAMFFAGRRIFWPKDQCQPGGGLCRAAGEQSLQVSLLDCYGADSGGHRFPLFVVLVLLKGEFP